MHTLLRQYAFERSTVRKTPQRTVAVRCGAVRCEGCTATTCPACRRPRLLYPNRRVLPDLPDEATAFTEPAAAWAWLDTELQNVVSMIGDAPRHGLPEVSWHLADALRGFLIARPYHHENWYRSASSVLAAAQLANDEQAQTAIHLDLGGVSWVSGDSQAMLDHSTPAAELDFIICVFSQL